MALRNAITLFKCCILGRRARGELRNTCLGDLTVEVCDGAQFLAKERVSKMRQGIEPRDVRNGIGKLAATDSPECPVTLLTTCKWPNDASSCFSIVSSKQPI